MAFMPWATHVLQWPVQRVAKPDSMKVESLVIVDQHATVNTFPGLVHTARHTTRVGDTRSCYPNPQGMEVPKVCLVRGVKS